MLSKEKVLEMALYRKQRLDELKDFINQSTFQGVMSKTVGFLADAASDRVRLSITAGTDSYTDGKSIVLGLKDFFFMPEFTRHDWVALFKALLAHEVQHINSSNFNDIKKIGQDYAKLMAAHKLPDKLVQKIARDMLNILEDGRIENIIIHKYPGYRLPFILLNSSHISLSELDQAAEQPQDEFTDFINSVLCYVKTGRLPRGISVYAGTRFETEYKKIQPLLDLAVDARTSSDCREICMRVLKLTADYFADLLKQCAQNALSQMMEGEDAKNGGQGSEYTTNGEFEYNDSPNGSDEERAAASAAAGDGKDSAKGKGKGAKGSKKDKKDGKDDGDDDGKSDTKGNNTGRNEIRPPDPSRRSSTSDWTDDFSGDGMEDYQNRDIPEELMAALRRGVRDELYAIEEEENKKEPEDREMKKIEEMYGKEYIRKFSELFPTIPTNPLPPDLESAGRKLETAFERVLRVKRTEKRNMRVGVISGRDLYRVGMRDPHIFMRKGQPMKADLAVFLLLDNSGSMGAQGARVSYDGTSTYADKSSLSRIAAGIIERGLSKFAAIKISLFDVSGGVIRHSTVKKFDERAVGSKCFNSIKSVGIGGGNKDGYSIRVATKDLMARREPKKILIVLSDGLPSDYNGGDSAGLTDVKEAVREARRKGVVVIPIMFGRASDRERMKDNFAFMYDKFISADPADISDEFQKLFIKLVANS